MTGNPVGLVEFLLARYIESQQRIENPPEWRCTNSARGNGWGSRGDCPICGQYMFDGTEEVTEDAFYEHYEAVHQRSYVLADIAAKRRIIEQGGSMCVGYYPPGSEERLADERFAAEHGVEFEPHWPEDYHAFCDGCAAAQSADGERLRVLRLLAAPFSSHPDWQPEWSTE